IHRLLSSWEQVRGADAIIVVAGMEGALASVVAGIADAPIIAVPTSVGYGASFGGISALLTMLNSCAGGVTVVNIDNGFGAGYAAAVICRKIYGGKGVGKGKEKAKTKAQRRGKGSGA
ncbi:MAG: AIR carboxylase family protein, partial [Candidatus Krumholzibacteria bacterium]|nr:AIR carboxylase family protein [Candidatus Krumholzibacteria bacterium]